jgi:D-methionine transport system substrate-binding protein
MKKLSLILATILLLFGFANAKTLKIGASSIPHAEILEVAKPILKKEGIDLKVIIFQDYILPNRALASKDLDANYFQHSAYLDNQIKEYGYKFINAGSIHIEPIGIYSKRYKSLDELKEGDTVIFSNSVADRTRVLLLLQSAKLITLKKGIDVNTTANLSDIVSNPKKLKFNNNIDPALLARAYNSNEAALIIINTNYALEARLNPTKDALFIENKDSPYANLIAVREEDKNNPDILKLVKVLKSEEVAKFIANKYNGAIVHIKN